MNYRFFTLTSDHVKLLRHAYTSWNFAEFGAPSIDPKRPYGNGDVHNNMIKILGLQVPIDSDGYYLVSEKVARDLDWLHADLETALEVVLRTGSFKPGVYRAGMYDSNWVFEDKIKKETK